MVDRSLLSVKTDLFIRNKDQVYVKVECERGVSYELRDAFTFMAPNYMFNPKYKNKMWDGKIRLFNVLNHLIYRGLTKEIEKFCRDRNYTYSYEEEPLCEEFSIAEATALASRLSDRHTIRDYQTEAIVSAIRSKRQLLVSPTGCHAAGTLVLMYDGTSCKVEDIKVGDLLMGPDNKPRTVLRLCRGREELYRIKPKTGANPFIVNASHILALRVTNGAKNSRTPDGSQQFISVRDYLAETKSYRHCTKLERVGGIELPKRNLPVPPWVVGAFIGDGCQLHTITITTPDIEIDKRVSAWGSSLGLRTRRQVKANGNKAWVIHLVGLERKTYGRGRPNPAKVLFEQIGIWGLKSGDKRVPKDYLLSDKNDRAELLAGLIDTDGHYDGKGFEYSSKSFGLVEDVCFLARSLGHVVHNPVSKEVNGVTYYRTNIYGNLNEIPVITPRRKAGARKQIKNHLLSGFSVEPVGEGEFYGFTLSDDHLYLTSDFVIHHNSGKSLLIYLLLSKFLDITKIEEPGSEPRFRGNKKKGLIIVPTVNLVEQLFTDFQDYASEYGLDVEKVIHRLYAGKDKTTTKSVTLSTWQSLVTMPANYFHQFDFVVGDEAHGFQAKSLKYIMDNLINTEYRIGTTGTIKDTKIDKLVLIGMFGPVKEATSTAALIEEKHLADFEIKCLLLKHPEKECRAVSKYTYEEEIKYIIANEKRNKFLKNLALSLPETTLVLFQYVEKHGEDLYKSILAECGDRKVLFVSGSNTYYRDTRLKDREEARQIANNNKGVIIVASYGTFSTGVNIPGIENIIFASPSKARIRVLQSLGRALRNNTGKTKAVLYDIADDLRSLNRKKENYTLGHFIGRLGIYTTEKFNFKIYKIKMKED